MNRCPGCFKPNERSYCRRCRKRLFDGAKVAFQLPFSRPSYDKHKLEITPDRMSISGIQPKISVALNHGKLQMVPSGGAYLLKPRPYGVFQRLEIVPINEHLTVQIARQVFDLQVAENALIAFQDEELAYLVRRFDIQPDGTRLLQEDLAQVASRSEETHGRYYKYDCSYEEVGDLIRKYVGTYKIDLERFFTLIVFNYLVNNGDAHMKNFSLIRNDQTGEYNLSPAYDLLNTRLHVPDESPTALDLFKDGFETESFRVNGFYAFDDFLTFARRLQLVENRVRRILDGAIHKQHMVFEFIDSSMLPEDCKQLYRDHVADRVQALSYSFSGWRV